jgi:hypothetical protein
MLDKKNYIKKTDNKEFALKNKKNYVDKNDTKEFILKNKKKESFLKLRKLKYLIQINFSDVFLNTFFDRFLNTYTNKVDIRFAPNNIFGTCAVILGAKVVKSVSAGVFKLKSSRKMKKYIFHKFISKFRNILQKTLQKKVKTKKRKLSYENTIVTLTVNKKFRRQIKKTFQFINNRKLKKNKILYVIRPKKCFNGCRVSKKRRKKRIRFRVFK